jgi:hypothetical protein
MAIHRRIRSIGVAIVTTLLLAPSALAMPIREPAGSAPEPDAAGPVVVTRPAGFSWADAAVGAGLAISLCALVLALIVLLRRTGFHSATARTAR